MIIFKKDVKMYDAWKLAKKLGRRIDPRIINGEFRVVMVK